MAEINIDDLLAGDDMGAYPPPPPPAPMAGHPMHAQTGYAQMGHQQDPWQQPAVWPQQAQHKPIKRYQGWILKPLKSSDEKTVNWNELESSTKMDKTQDELREMVLKTPYKSSLHDKSLGQLKGVIEALRDQQNNKDNCLDPKNEWKIAAVKYTQKDISEGLMKVVVSKLVVTQLKVVFERKPRLVLKDGKKESKKNIKLNSASVPAKVKEPDFFGDDGGWDQGFSHGQHHPIPQATPATQNWSQNHGQANFGQANQWPKQTNTQNQWPQNQGLFGQVPNVGHQQPQTQQYKPPQVHNPQQKWQQGMQSHSAQAGLGDFYEQAVVDDDEGWTPGDQFVDFNAGKKDKAYGRRSGSPEIIIPSSGRDRRDSRQSSRPTSFVESENWSSPGSPKTSISGISLIGSDINKRGSKDYYHHSRGDSYGSKRDSGIDDYVVVHKKHSRNKHGSTSYPRESLERKHSRTASYSESKRRESEHRARARDLEREVEKLKIEDLERRVELHEHRKETEDRIRQLESTIIHSERERERENERERREIELAYSTVPARRALPERSYTISTPSRRRPSYGYGSSSYRDRREDRYREGYFDRLM